MRVSAWLLACLLALSAQVQAESPGKRPLVFAPLPLENEPHTVTANRPLLALLARLTGREVDMQIYNDYSALLADFQAGRVDLAELGPLPLLRLQDATTRSRPLVTFREAGGETTYRCVLTVPDDGAHSLAALAARPTPLRVALPRPLSTCGYLSTIWQLQEAGAVIDGMTMRYMNGQDAAALALVRAEFDVGGLKESVAHRFSPLGLRVVGVSPNLPGFSLVANDATLSRAERELLTQQLLALEPAVLGTLGNGRHGFAPFESADLLWLRKMRSDLLMRNGRVEP